MPVRGALTVEHPDHGGLAWSGTSAALGVPLELRLRPTTWGLVTVGPVWVRVHGPFGLVRWEGAVGPTTTLRVLPGPASTRVLLQAAEPRAIAGSHLARIRGDGLEFAEVRPYAPGDRLRAVNWSVSARRDGIWVNQRHPERSADLVVLVDTFADDRDGNAAALVPAVRAAWVLATAHLSAHDRVGLVTFGGYPAWIAPGSGERALLAFCDRLLAHAARRGRRPSGRCATSPPSPSRPARSWSGSRRCTTAAWSWPSPTCAGEGWRWRPSRSTWAPSWPP